MHVFILNSRVLIAANLLNPTQTWSYPPLSFWPLWDWSQLGCHPVPLLSSVNEATLPCLFCFSAVQVVELPFIWGMLPLLFDASEPSHLNYVIIAWQQTHYKSDRRMQYRTCVHMYVGLTSHACLFAPSLSYPEVQSRRNTNRWTCKFVCLFCIQNVCGW